MTNTDFDALVRGIEPLRACLIVEATSGALHREFRRGPLSVDPETVARAVAGLARAQTDIVGLAEPATSCTLEWPGVVVIVRSVSASALVVFFFNAGIKLGIARMHITNVLDQLDAMLPSPRSHTVRTLPTVPPPPERDPEPEPEPAAAFEPDSKAQRLLRYLDEHAPDTHAALLRVSLQTGLPLSLLKTPEQLSTEEFDQVTASVRRILGVEQLPV